MEGFCFKTRVRSLSSPAISSLPAGSTSSSHLRRNLSTLNALPPPSAAAASSASISLEKSHEIHNLHPLRMNPSWTDPGFDNLERAPSPGSGDDNSIFEILHVKSRCGKHVIEEEVLREEVDRDLWKERVELDTYSFRRLLRRVTLNEAKVYAQMSYLGNLAYHIPKIKPTDLQRRYGLRYVTSSFDKKQVERKPSKDPVCTGEKKKESENIRSLITATMAFQIVASAASYTKNMLPFISPPKEKPIFNHGCTATTMNSDMASFMATTDSVTAVVAAKEEVKQAVANRLNSNRSSPCEWFVCDDHTSRTRLFVIQGSETLASWQANLLFEPTQFEGLDFPVHRGIYEAAKGIYGRMLPEVRAHLESEGDGAAIRFTGHSLGGSLALLVSLLLVIRGEVPPTCLLPVITFGSPSVLFDGDRLLYRLGLPLTHLHAVIMHRDIVPRAFSCTYPDHVAAFLKAVNKTFRTHPRLSNNQGQKVLYPPMGQLLILQPDGEFSPPHHLLPEGRGLYMLGCEGGMKAVEAARALFIDSPHPLDTLRERGAYGSEGTIQRDHDMKSYVKTMRGVVWELLRSRRTTNGLWWPPPLVDSRRGPGRSASVLVRAGCASLNWFAGLVSSHPLHLLFVSFPARMLLGKIRGFGLP